MSPLVDSEIDYPGILQSLMDDPDQIAEIAKRAEQHLNASLLTVISDTLKPPPNYQLASASVLLAHRQATVTLQLTQKMLH